MKKVWITLFLVFVMLSAGCEGTDSALSSDEPKPAVTASGRSFFWDKDLRPAVAVPSKAVARPKIVVQEPEPEPPTEIVSAIINGLLEDVEEIVERRREIAHMYRDLLGDLEMRGLGFAGELSGGYHSWMMFPLLARWCEHAGDKYHFMSYLYD